MIPLNFGGLGVCFWQFQDFGAALVQGSTSSVSRVSPAQKCRSMCPFPFYLDLDKAKWQNDHRFTRTKRLPMKVGSSAIAPSVYCCSSP